MNENVLAHLVMKGEEAGPGEGAEIETEMMTDGGEMMVHQGVEGMMDPQGVEEMMDIRGVAGMMDPQEEVEGIGKTEKEEEEVCSFCLE